MGRIKPVADASQKRITSFFARQHQPAAQAGPSASSITTRATSAGNRQKRGTGTNKNLEKSSDSSVEEDEDFKRHRNKRRKTSRFASTDGHDRPIVDLTDSDQEEKISFIPLSLEPKTDAVPDEDNTKENVPSYVRIVEFKTEVEVTVEAVVEEPAEDPTTTEGYLEPERIVSPSLLDDDAGDLELDNSFVGLISVRPMKQILEDSQGSLLGSSMEAERSVTDVHLAETQLMEPNHLFDSSTSISFGGRSQSQPHIFSTPKKVSEPTTTSISTGGKASRKTPRSAVHRFSPLHSLNSSKKGKKTPTKALFSPFKSGPKQSPSKPTLPYYLRNFIEVIRPVVQDVLNKHLLNDEDMDIYKKFNALSVPAKCLYVRMFGRQWRWIPATQLKYENIADDLFPVLDELYSNGLLMEIRDDTRTLNEVLEVLDAEKLNIIARRMNLKAKTREAIISELLKLCGTQVTLQGSMETVVHNNAIKLLPKTYKLKPEPKHLFSRLFIMYYPPQYWEQEEDKDTLQLLSMLLVETKKLKYPQFIVNRTTAIYNSRDEVLRFHEAWLAHAKINTHKQNKEWNQAAVIARQAFGHFKDLLDNQDLVNHHSQMPSFLRAYVPSSLFGRATWMGVDCFQREKHYSEANEVIECLLSQTTYLRNYRGRWYERLIVNSGHLKKGNEAIAELILQALQDDHVKECYKLEFTARYEKLQKSMELKNQKKVQKNPNLKRKNNKTQTKKKYVDTSSSESDNDTRKNGDEAQQNPVGEPPAAKRYGYYLKHDAKEITIEGEKMPMFDREYGKSYFLGQSAEGDDALSSVENFAISYYRTRGFEFSVHAEGAVSCSIFGLLFWDLIYSARVPDVFRCPYQAYPLDLMFDEFYSNRRIQVDDYIAKLRAMTMEEVLQIMEQNYEKNAGQMSIVSWNVFSSFDLFKTLVPSIGKAVLLGICDRLVQDYRHCRAGFPDLVVWNGTSCSFVEVKGPGDKLSAKQKIWIDYLLDVGAQVEICHVKAVSNKRIRTSV